MWLIPKSTLSPCSPESADSTSASSSPFDAWATPDGSIPLWWRSKPIRWPSRLSGEKRDDCLSWLASRTLSPSTAARFVAALTSSWRASRANRGAWQAGAPALTTTAGSGPQWHASLGTFNPDGSFSKTCPDFFEADSDPSSLTLPRSGSMRSGRVYEHQMLERRTGESGCSWWPTPDANVMNDGESPESCERRRAAWPTPTKQDASSSGAANYSTESGRHSGTTLCDATERATAWPSPTARDHKGSLPLDRRGRTMGALDEAAEQMWSTPDASVWKGGNHSGSGTMLSRSVATQSETFNATPTSRAFHPAPTITPPGEPSSSDGLSSRPLWASPRAAMSVFGASGTNRDRGKNNIEDQAAMMSNPQKEKRRLNPLFVAWLMGLSPDWLVLRAGEPTPCAPEGTASCQSRPPERCAS